MIIGPRGYQRDIYKCVDCQSWIGPNDKYCNKCGHEFSTPDVKMMIARSTFWNSYNAPFHYALDQKILCSSCGSLESLRSYFCKNCGFEFNRDKLTKLREKHTKTIIFSSILGAAFFIAIFLATVLLNI